MLSSEWMWSDFGVWAQWWCGRFIAHNKKACSNYLANPWPPRLTLPRSTNSIRGSGPPLKFRCPVIVTTKCWHLEILRLVSPFAGNCKNAISGDQLQVNILLVYLVIKVYSSYSSNHLVASMPIDFGVLRAVHEQRLSTVGCRFVGF